MDKILFDRSTLKWIAKSPADLNPTTTSEANLMLPAHGYALAIVSPGANLSDLKPAIRDVSPGARILEITVPQGDSETTIHHQFLTILAKEAGLEIDGSESAEDICSRLPPFLYAAFDYLIEYHAERLGTFGLHCLRRDRGMPPSVLISYSEEILATIQKDLVLARYTYFLPT